MKVGIMQPYFMPYLGYWQLIKAVDKYVVYDDVNFIKQGWINRNNLLVEEQKKLFTIILNGATPNKLINEIELKDDFIKFRKTIGYNYSKAPYFENIMLMLDDIFHYENKNLGEFLFNSINKVCDYLAINTEIILSSEINKNNELKSKDKVLHICKLLKANEYYNAIGGQDLYNKKEFENHGIRLKFLQAELVPYKQFNNEFISGLSIIDVLMFNSVEEVNKMLDNYELL